MSSRQLRRIKTFIKGYCVYLLPNSQDLHYRKCIGVGKESFYFLLCDKICFVNSPLSAWKPKNNSTLWNEEISGVTSKRIVA